MTSKIQKSKKQAEDIIFQLHISLQNSSPLVWRRILVPGNFTLEALHSVFQLTMGWQMCHLYDFEIESNRFSEPDEFTYENSKPVKPLSTKLVKAVTKNLSFTYNYDFGDSWQHIIKVEEITSAKDVYQYPICIGGENACPPEDCGGTPGYDEFKKAIKDPNHEEHLSLLRWVGGYFDPKSFDPNRINRDMLRMINWNKKPNDQGLYIPFNLEA